MCAVFKSVLVNWFVIGKTWVHEKRFLLRNCFKNRSAHVKFKRISAACIVYRSITGVNLVIIKKKYALLGVKTKAMFTILKRAFYT